MSIFELIQIDKLQAVWKICFFLLNFLNHTIAFCCKSCKLLSRFVNYILFNYDKFEKNEKMGNDLPANKNKFTDDTPFNEKISYVDVPQNKKRNVYISNAHLIDAKRILETWWENNKEYPFASKTDITELSIRTQLDEKKITNWLNNKRMRSKILEKPRKCFTENDKQILSNFFTTRTENPGLNDLILLSKIINKDEKKIRAWFNRQRYQKKQNIEQ